jgi:predicted AlkP superfamily phosphohydrolase/phosphomutase
VVGRYLVDVEQGYRTNDKRRLLADIEEMTDKRFRLAEHLLETRPWELFFMVEMGTDRIHHGLWRFTDPEYRLYEPGNPYEGAMLDYYRGLDERIAGLLRLADDDTAVLVVSDHGAKRLDGGICVNEWLRRKGYLVLREEPREPVLCAPRWSTGSARRLGERAGTTAGSSSTSRGESRLGSSSRASTTRLERS